MMPSASLASTSDPAFRGGQPAAARSWRARAACLDKDPELFFPIGDQGPALPQIAEAKAVCQRCPVAHKEDFGVWGGTTEEERRLLRRQRSASSRRAA
jgi:WhiB family redox-sensing transcriptional regulator